MTRFRLTVRGEGIELRGFVDADAPYQIGRLFADDLDERAILVASPATDTYDPFSISEPTAPPTIEASREVIESIHESSPDEEEFQEYVSVLHFQQANVIRGERHRAEVAESALSNALTKAIENVSEMMLGSSSFAEAAREGAIAALRQVFADTINEAGPPRG